MRRRGSAGAEESFRGRALVSRYGVRATALARTTQVGHAVSAVVPRATVRAPVAGTSFGPSRCKLLVAGGALTLTGRRGLPHDDRDAQEAIVNSSAWRGLS